MIGAQLPISGQVDLLDIAPSYGDFLDASLEMGWMRNPVPSWLRYMEREEARGKDLTNYLDPSMAELYRILGVPSKRDPNDVTPLIPKSRLNEIYGPEGLNFDKDEHAEVAALIAAQKRRENRLNETRRRAESSRTYGTGFLAEMAAGIADPLNIASAFIPVVGQARFASMLTRMGPTTARATRGLIEGAVGAAVVEPLVLMGALGEQADYTALDSLLNVAFGGILGGGLHTGIGAIRDIRARATGRLTEGDIAHVLDAVERERASRTATPQNDVAVRFDAMPIADRENLMRATVAQMEEGKSVTIGLAHRAMIDAEPLAIKTDAAATAFIKEFGATAQLTKAEADAITRYGSPGEFDEAEFWNNPETRAAMLSAAKKYTLDRDIVAYRGSHVGEAIDLERAARSEIFTPVTLSRSWAETMAAKYSSLGVHEVIIPKGTSALPISRGDLAEAELLLPPGTKFKRIAEREYGEFSETGYRDANGERLDDPVKLTQMIAHNNEVRTADFEASKDASAKLEASKAPTDAEREIADLETEIADIASRMKPLQESTGIEGDLLKAHDEAIAAAKKETQAYQIAAACKLGL